MILVIGANGITGRAIVRHLVAAGAPVRGLVSNAQSAALVAAAGAEPVVGSIRDEGELTAAMSGVERVYHICPRMQADELAIGETVIEAARNARVRHIVYHSATPPHLADVPFHWEKMKVEVALLESGIDFTTVRPTNYMQNIMWTWQRILDDGVWELPYSADRKISWLDVEDIGAAAARILTEPGHEGATYEICGQPPITRHDIAPLIGRALRKTVVATKIDLDEYMAMPYWNGRKPEDMERLKTMFRHYDRVGCNIGNTRVLAMLLGRTPTNYETFVERFAAERAAAASAERSAAT